MRRRDDHDDEGDDDDAYGFDGSTGPILVMLVVVLVTFLALARCSATSCTYEGEGGRSAPIEQCE